MLEHLNVYYNPGIPTADGSKNGTIRFGSRGFMNYITGMHEIAHTIGVGTNWNWSNLMINGLYIGKNANAVLRSITGDQNSTIHGDGAHFWPYGLNYTSEVKSSNDLINHCRIIQAMLKDGL